MYSIRNVLRTGDCLYSNPLLCKEDMEDFVCEGDLHMSFSDKGTVISGCDNWEKLGDHAHFVLWCKKDFPDSIAISWEFAPINDTGLCMMFFAASGRHGEDLFDPALPKRSGFYPEYHSGAINALHLSYFRRKWQEEKAFRTCNLRKSHGFHLVAQGADPIPCAADAMDSYKLQILKHKNLVEFSVNGLAVLQWADNGVDYGDVLKGGKIGIRQMAPMSACYKNLMVHKLEGC